MKHCFKCNDFKPVVGGGMCLTGNGRRRFICGACVSNPRIHNRLVVRYVAAPTKAVAAHSL